MIDAVYARGWAATWRILPESAGPEQNKEKKQVLWNRNFLGC